MRLDDGAGERKSEAQPVLFRRHEGGRGPLGEVGIKAWAIVLHANHDIPCTVMAGFDHHPSVVPAGIGKCLRRIAHQIDDHLLDLQRVHFDGGQIARDAQLQLHAMSIELRMTIRDRLVDKLCHSDGCGFASAEPDEIAQTANDIRCALDLGDDAV